VTIFDNCEFEFCFCCHQSSQLFLQQTM
jgi:hypothetical protein